jgi:hypothetical protein
LGLFSLSILFRREVRWAFAGDRIRSWGLGSSVKLGGE